jgi:hypothetical protein
MAYTVTETTLAAVPKVHQGTGTHRATNWVVNPTTVPGSGLMTFSGLDGQVTTKLFAIADAVVPNWFGVALPAGLSDFTRPHIFFHPTPGQAGYLDGDYWKKSGKWPELFYYMERLGYQLDGAQRNQVLIMPFMTEEAKNGGILPANWQSIVTQILRRVRADVLPSATSTLKIRQLVVSSFSAGIIYSDNFRRTGANVASALAEVWDFDGRYSSYHAISEALHSTAKVQAIKYDQVTSSDPSAYHVPLPRWQKLADPPTSSNEVHGLIRDFMFLDAASVSHVGSIIDTAAATSADTGTATQTATARVSGTASASTTGSATVTDSAAGPADSVYNGPPPPTAVPGGLFPPLPTIPPVPVIAPPRTTTAGWPQAAPATGPQTRQVPPACTCTAVPALVAVVATTAQTAITAIASTGCKAPDDSGHRN